MAGKVRRAWCRLPTPIVKWAHGWTGRVRECDEERAAEQCCTMQRQSRGRESAVGQKTDARVRFTRYAADGGSRRRELCGCFAPSTADFRPRLCFGSAANLNVVCFGSAAHLFRICGESKRRLFRICGASVSGLRRIYTSSVSDLRASKRRCRLALAIGLGSCSAPWVRLGSRCSLPRRRHDAHPTRGSYCRAAPTSGVCPVFHSETGSFVS